MNLVDFNEKIKFFISHFVLLVSPVFIPVLSLRLGWASVGLAVFARGVGHQQLQVVDFSNRFGCRVSALMSFSR
jgi:hypothetical protein